MRTQKEIIEALNVLKDVCKENDCERCPFYIGTCKIMKDSPCEYRINNETEHWTALLN